MNGAAASAQSITNASNGLVTPNSTWSVAGLGDFNGDGFEDVLWRNSNGALTEWTMNGSQATATQTVTYNGAAITPVAAASVVGVGDFNADGNADVLWRNATTVCSRIGP